MENDENVGSGSNEPGTNDNLTGNEADDNAAASGGSNAETGETGVGEGGEESGQAQGDAEGAGIETIEDEEGNKFVPFKAFQEKIASLTKQKGQFSDAASLLESIKTDPQVREEFVKSLGINTDSANGETSGTVEEIAPFEKFLAPLPANHQVYYRAMGRAIAEEMEAFVEDYVKEQLAPVMRHMGSTQVENFSAKVGDFPKYQKEVESKIGKPISLEEAYILASYRDKIKGVGTAKAKEEVNRFKQSQRFPNNNVNSSGKGTVKNNSEKTLKEALVESAKETGYIK